MLSARKLKSAVFWCRKRVLMVEFMQQGPTVTSQVYSQTLKERRGVLISSLVLLHHTFLHSSTTAAFKRELFNHPDLAPSYYRLS
jgi:hypothetical protein